MTSRIDMERMPAMTEAEITRGIRRMLDALGVFNFKHWSGPMSMKGIADILGCYQGRFLAIEVKTLTGRLSPAQEQFLERVRKAGGLAFVARSIDDAIDALGVRGRFLF
jgi:Holliday junction resolvase